MAIAAAVLAVACGLGAAERGRDACSQCIVGVESKSKDTAKADHGTSEARVATDQRSCTSQRSSVEASRPVWHRHRRHRPRSLQFAFNQALVVGWQTVYVYVLLIIGVLFIVIFIYGEGKALYPLLPTSVFHLSGTFILISLACGWASFGIWLFYVNLMQQTHPQLHTHFHPAHFVPAGVAGIIAAFSSAHILGRTSPPFVMLLSLLAFCIGSCIAGNAPVRVESLRISHRELCRLVWTCRSPLRALS